MSDGRVFGDADPVSAEDIRIACDQMAHVQFLNKIVDVQAVSQRQISQSREFNGKSSFHTFSACQRRCSTQTSSTQANPGFFDLGQWSTLANSTQTTSTQASSTHANFGCPLFFGRFWPIRLRPIGPNRRFCVVLCVVVCVVVCLCVSVCCCVLVQDLCAPPNPFPAGPPKISFFFPSPATLSLGVFSYKFWWCLKRRGMCTFRVLGLSCEARRLQSSKTPPKFHERTPREKKERKLWWEGKKRGILGHPPFGPPTLRGPTRAVLFGRWGLSGTNSKVIQKSKLTFECFGAIFQCFCVWGTFFGTGLQIKTYFWMSLCCFSVFFVFWHLVFYCSSFEF